VVNDCDGVHGSFGTLSGSAATNYVEVSFAPPAGEEWALGRSGGQSGPINLRFYKEHFATQDQTNDYSFDAEKAEVPQPWEHVTLYRGGVLLFGDEPD
jgi:hypothetical protein